MKRTVLAVAILLAVASPLAAGEKAHFEKSVSFVGDKDLRLGIRSGDVTIESVRIRHWPDSDDLAKGAKDLNDTHTMVVEFTYSNRDEKHDYKCTYLVTIPGRDGKPWGENDRTATLDKGKIEDTNKMFVKMKTHQYKQAKTMKLVFDIWRKD